jgi:Zn-finger nucleic acid-binding protein
MRILVACSDCRRQYDATGRRIGSRFRCRCGSVVTVKPPRGHEAAVVRCASCGAPCEENSTNCRYCTADFTLHDRDLDTVCPNCLARVSSRARFCHHCATRLTSETVAKDQSPLPCPECGDSERLYSRQLGHVAALECSGCLGLWLGNAAFEQLTEKATEAAMQKSRLFEAKAIRAFTPMNGTGHEEKKYRPCPECGSLMLRRHYGRRSGIVIDVCQKHGIWFDSEELPRILDWIRQGGLAQAEAERAQEKERAKRLESTRRPSGSTAMGMGGSDDSERGLLDTAVDTFVSWLTGF